MRHAHISPSAKVWIIGPSPSPPVAGPTPCAYSQAPGRSTPRDAPSGRWGQGTCPKSKFSKNNNNKKRDGNKADRLLLSQIVVLHFAGRIDLRLESPKLCLHLTGGRKSFVSIQQDKHFEPMDETIACTWSPEVQRIALHLHIGCITFEVGSLKESLEPRGNCKQQDRARNN